MIKIELVTCHVRNSPDDVKEHAVIHAYSSIR